MFRISTTPSLTALGEVAFPYVGDRPEPPLSGDRLDLIAGLLYSVPFCRPNADRLSLRDASRRAPSAHRELGGELEYLVLWALVDRDAAEALADACVVAGQAVLAGDAWSPWGVDDLGKLEELYRWALYVIEAHDAPAGAAGELFDDLRRQMVTAAWRSLWRTLLVTTRCRRPEIGRRCPRRRAGHRPALMPLRGAIDRHGPPTPTSEVGYKEHPAA